MVPPCEVWKADRAQDAGVGVEDETYKQVRAAIMGGMSARKTPVLLRRGPLSGSINALTRYTRPSPDLIQATMDGKHDVTADFDALVCEMLLDESPDIAGILDGVADGQRLTDDECQQVSDFRKNLVAIIERHNAGPHVKH